MRRLITTAGLIACFAVAFSQTVTQINGTVSDEKKQPVPFANIYIEGSIEGTSSGEDGTFALSSNTPGTVTLIISFLGYEPYSITDDVKMMRDLKIILKPIAAQLDEVVVYAGSYQLKSSSTLNKSKAVDLVSTAGSSGDMYKAISMLPGTQAADRDGRLLVRGGSDRETQTYIDDMHVLSPYTASVDGEASARGRYSPFLFDGINFSMGGYIPEYSQGLSAVLPLYTSDEANTAKSGIDIMNVSLGHSATFPWHGGSTSYNIQYVDMSLYNSLFFPEVKPYWKDPYRQLALQHQLRFTPGKNSSLKTYLGWSKTGFTLKQTPPFTGQSRDLRMSEDNLYFNTTFRKKQENGLAFFAGAACSFNRQKTDNALTTNDAYRTKEQEGHLKTKAEKRVSDHYKITTGAEAFFRRYSFYYADRDTFDIRFSPFISGAFVSNDFNLPKNWFLNLSARIEYTSMSERWQILPRAAIGYKRHDFIFSGVIGKYQQNVSNEILIYNSKLLPENNIQALFGIYYEKGSKLIRLEAYQKKYNRLPLKTGESHPFYSSEGSGFSKGFDLFLNDTDFLKHWEYMIAYSFNDSQREYLDFPESAAPSFAMRHNASVTLKYTRILFDKHIHIISLTNRFASGRAYHDPNRAGFMDARTSAYNSLDASWIILPNKRLIVYLGFSNILNRKNIYGYTFNSVANENGIFESSPLTQRNNQGCYIGCFISLGKKAAYNASNFF